MMPRYLGLTATGLAVASVFAYADPWSFTDVTVSAGLNYVHGFSEGPQGTYLMSGGVAAGDYDGDGFVDLYVVRGDIGPNLLLRNRGDGTFAEEGALAGVDISGVAGCGPVFADVDGDGFLDLTIGGTEFVPVTFLRNRGPGQDGQHTFEDVSSRAGLPLTRFAFGAAYGDFDGDGDLDLFLPQWNRTPGDLLWRNDGDVTFSSATAGALSQAAQTALLFTFTPNFTDLDFDGWPDLVVASDFGNSQVLLSNGPDEAGEVTFRLATDTSVVIDENGMGAAVADFDNDGRLDWFVSSIYGAGKPIGNRLYRGRGDGTFDDATPSAGVAEGYWGWGSCFADFNNDGLVDLFHVNGYRDEGYQDDPSRLFMNLGDGTFREEALARGIDDRRQGRGVVCFDYDRDGDLDIFIANNSDAPRLYRNEGVNQTPSLAVRLRGRSPNTQGIGARLLLRDSTTVLTQEIRAGNNYVSQNPAIAHFGLGTFQNTPELLITWPGGLLSTLYGEALPAAAASRQITVEEGLIVSDGFESGDLYGWIPSE